MDDKTPNQFDLKINGEKVQVTPRKAQTEKDRNYLILFYVGSSGQIAFAILVPLLLGIFAGIWLDTKYKTKPMWTLSGLLVGIIFSVLTLIKTVQEIIKNASQNK